MNKLIKIDVGIKKVASQIAITNKILNSLEQANDDIEMVFIKGGVFNMGFENDSENPIHPVTLNDYYIGKYPITIFQWKKLMSASDESLSQIKKENFFSRIKKSFSVGNPPKQGIKYPQDEKIPITSVALEEVHEFIFKLNQKFGKSYRLPTEAEWEYAAKGGKNGKRFTHSGSNDFNEVGWFLGNCSQIQPVGQKMPNELGVYDMSGNIAEWCVDRFRRDYYNVVSTQNPKCEDGGDPVVRGGSYRWSDRSKSTIASRSCWPPIGGECVGFRLACNIF